MGVGDDAAIVTINAFATETPFWGTNYLELVWVGVLGLCGDWYLVDIYH